ncbi:MAG TPA: IS110 family transposase, partial [Pseudonocardiaceae bacterium]|nr:IS110 family transposase [Pseudonocardiaceae bacterium]
MGTFADGSATNLACPQARAILAIASTPAAGTRLSQARIASALRCAGRQRGIDTLAAHIHQTLRIA